jgi:DNA gyrase subunit A
MKLAQDDRIIAVDIASADGQLLLASQQGFTKRTFLKEFPTKGRYTGGVVTYSGDSRTGPLVAARVVSEDEDAVFVTQNGNEIRLRVENVTKANRGARGKQTFDVKGGDKVTGLVNLGANAGQQKENSAPTNGEEALARTRIEAKHKKSEKAEDGQEPEPAASKVKPRIKSDKKESKSEQAGRTRKKPSRDKREQMEFAAFKPLPKKKK